MQWIGVDRAVGLHREREAVRVEVGKVVPISRMAGLLGG